MPDMLQDTISNFNEVLSQYEGMIYHLIQRLNIKDYDGEFYQAGLIALWESYQKYYGRESFPKITYITIRSRLIDMIRKNNRLTERETVTDLVSQNSETYELVDFGPDFWEVVYSALTEKQCLYVKKRIIQGKSLKEIAAEENTTVDAVKGWGKEVKRKLRPVLEPYLL